MRREKVFKILSIFVMLFILWFSHQDAKESASQLTYVKKQVNKVISKGVRVNIRKNTHIYGFRNEFTIK